MSTDHTRPEPESTDASDDASGTAPSEERAYEPPQVDALGTLPESTGMPASPQSFPDDPTR